MRQWLCLSLFLTQDIPHLPHSPSPWLLSPFCFVPHYFGVPVPISSCPAAPSPFVSNIVPWAAGDCGCPRPYTCLFNKALSLLSIDCVLFPEQWGCAPSRVGGQELGRGMARSLGGGFSLSLGSPPSPWGLRAPGVPLCLS